MSHRIEELSALPVEPLALLHAACFPDNPWDATAIARIAGLAGCFGLLAWDAETPVGFLLARDLGEECEVLALGVRPQWRRHGVGRALVAALVRAAARRGDGSLVLEVAADNEPAQRLYAAAGFVAVGRRPRYYARPEGAADALILRRNSPIPKGGA